MSIEETYHEIKISWEPSTNQNLLWVPYEDTFFKNKTYGRNLKEMGPLAHHQHKCKMLLSPSWI